jgi:muramoyltetrapeptide carboxypeptidase
MHLSEDRSGSGKSRLGGIDPGAKNATRWPSSERGHIMPAMPAQPAPRQDKIPSIDRVQVVLPSSPPHDPAHLDAGMAWLRAAGVQVTGPLDRDRRPLRHLAGPDHLRAQELAAALSHAPVDAIWCGRGGSGALRTLAALEHMQRRAAQVVQGATSRSVADSDAEQPGPAPAERSRLPLIGLSDATALLLWRAFGARPSVAIHGPVITQLPKLDDGSADALKTWLREPETLPTLRSDTAPRVAGTVDGPVVGGNLTLLAACAGTNEAISCRGRILLIEEVAEPAYRIDRLFSQLERSGALDGVLGVACGTFTDCASPAAVQACLDDWAQRLRVPWAGPFPVGHGVASRPVALGMRYRLAADGGTLEPLQSLSEAFAAAGTAA